MGDVKIYLRDLSNIANQKVYPVHLDYYEVKDNIFLRGLKNVNGDISFYYDNDDHLSVNYYLKGKMICPCAVSLEDVEVDFELSDDDVVVNNLDDEGFYLNRSMELEEMVLYIVLPEVPIKVVKKGKIEYSKGDGWAFLSQDEYEKSLNEKIDPRLEKLRDYSFEEED